MKNILLTTIICFVLTLAAVAAVTKPGLNKANFNQVQTGMTYPEVVAIIGREGDVISESKMGDIHTVMYQWKAKKSERQGLGANMNAMFQDDKLVSKAQAGLK